MRVNAVNPGVIVTDIHKRSGLTDENYEKFLEHSKTTHALGRVGTVQEVASMISFLASGQASFITGLGGEIIFSQTYKLWFTFQARLLVLMEGEGLCVPDKLG